MDFTLTEQASVQVSVTDFKGKETILAGPGKPKDTGDHEMTIDCADLPGGQYICKLTLRTKSGITRIFSRNLILIR
jgi:hypothetical protein